MQGSRLGLGVLVLAFGMTLYAHAQSTQAWGYVSYAVQNSDEGGTLCSNGGKVKAGCVATWNLNWANGSGSVSGDATYGHVTAKAASAIAVESDEGESASTGSGMDTTFSDVLSFPTLPDGTEATLRVTLKLSGATSVGNAVSSAIVNASVGLGYNGAYYSSCLLEAQGTCTATLPWTGGPVEADLYASLTVAVSAELPCCDTGTAGTTADFSGENGARITALTLKDSSGKSYEIKAASGHKYPK